MKGIIWAGRDLPNMLYPVVNVVPKTLVPIYDKPMIYYSLSLLMLAGIRQIAVIVTCGDIPLYQNLSKLGQDLGLRISVIPSHTGSEWGGIAKEFLYLEEFINNEEIAFVYGDTFLYGQRLTAELKRGAMLQHGAIVYGMKVKEPRAYGSIDSRDITLSGMPQQQDKVYYAQTGLYFYDKNLIEIAKKLKANEESLNLLNINREYLNQGILTIRFFGRGMAWLDTDTNDGLLNASNFVRTVQHRQGFYIACLEEIAYRKGYIDRTQLRCIANSLEKTDYRQYLIDLANEDNPDVID